MKKNYLSQFLPTLKDGVSLGNPNEILEIIKRHIFLSIYLFFHELKYLSFANILKKINQNNIYI